MSATQASQGWQAIEDELRLSGWSKARRVVVLRRRIKNDVALTGKKRGSRGGNGSGEQLVLPLPHDEVQDSAQLWEYTVLVTDVPYDIAAIGQLYRDRCDCEYGFDELKNQWGWGGFTTQDMHRSQINRARGGAGLQLVELVRASGQPSGPAQGADHSAVAAGGRGQGHQQW